MDLFTYTPGGHETIDAFNLRLAKYAADQNVTGVQASIIANTLVLSLATDEDIPSPILLRPFVTLVGQAGLATLETALSAVLDAIKAEDKPDDDITSIPIECKVYDALDVPTGMQGYAVFLIGVGELEHDD